MTEPGDEITKAKPLEIESETVDAIRARAPLEAILLDLMLLEGRAVMTDMTPDDVRDGIRERYGIDPDETAGMPRESLSEPLRLPLLTGFYSSAEVAKAVSGRLIDAGFPVLVERLVQAPPETQVIGTAEGDLVEGHQGPVWMIRTGSAEDHLPGAGE